MLLIGQGDEDDEHDDVAHAGGEVPGRRPGVDSLRTVSLAFELREFGEERHRHRQVQPDADSHDEAEGDEDPLVRCHGAADCGDDEEDHIGHEEPVAPEPIDEVAAEECADDGSDHDRGIDESGHEAVQAELLLDGGDAEGQGGEVVGVHEDPAEGEDDHCRRLRPLGAEFSEDRVDIGRRGDDARSLHRRLTVPGGWCLCRVRGGICRSHSRQVSDSRSRSPAPVVILRHRPGPRPPGRRTAADQNGPRPFPVSQFVSDQTRAPSPRRYLAPV